MKLQCRDLPVFLFSAWAQPRDICIVYFCVGKKPPLMTFAMVLYKICLDTRLGSEMSLLPSIGRSRRSSS